MARRVLRSGGVLTTAALAAVAIGIFAACKRQEGEHPSVLLVTIDTLRADHSSAYGYARPTTPHLDALARRGVRFEAAYAPMSTTGPSHATMFTSLLPRAHGVMKNGQPLAPEHRRLAQVLSENGYRSAAFVSSFPVNRRFGFAEGFAEYDDVFTGAHSTLKPTVWAGHAAPEFFDRRASETRVRVVEWLRSNGYLEGGNASAPFFLWVHLFDPHEPYDPPPGDRERIGVGPQGDDLQEAIADYDAEIRFADREMGAIFDALTAAGRFDRVLTIVAGDHGEGLMQHGHMYHGLFIYEESVRVPFVFHWPQGLAEPRVIEAPVQLVDLAPTVLELVGLAAVPRFQGVGLASVMRGRASADPDRPVFLERRHYETSTVDGFRVAGAKLGLRLGRWKYIEAREEGTRELYDLAADPAERVNLSETNRDKSAELARVLRSWAGNSAAAPVAPVSPEDAERLRALGYVQ